MRLSKLTIGVLACLILVALYLSKISNLVSVKYDYENDKIFERKFDTNIVMSDEFKNIVWFVQISDIHLSIFHDPGRIADFNVFCNKTLDVIRPLVVLASGDLTDAKNIDSMGSRQFVQEWKYYQETLKANEVEKKTHWLDTRGNHDNFDVPSLTVDKSFFHHYSIQGKRYLRSYMETFEKNGMKYSFIAVDACLDPGPRRPFNFIGLINPEEFRTLEAFEQKSQDSNGTVWFGHYPTSCILSPEPGVRKLMKKGVAYLCGHLHTLGGTVPNMYTLHHSGTLELELGDWKDNRLFRVAAFDHGLFSFTDVLHGTWPVVLITNPKHALFSLPKKEPVEYLKISTHIRVLVFSPSKLVSVKFQINDGSWLNLQHVEGPMYVHRWDPSDFASGVHYIRVIARNADDEETSVHQPFTLDNTKLSFRLLPRIALMLDAAVVFQNLFIFLVVVTVTPVVFLKFLYWVLKGKPGSFDKLRLKRGPVWGIVRKIWLFTTINKVFYPLLFYPIYISIGPWFIGEVLEGYYGAVFAWGTYVGGKVLPGSFTYFYGFIQLQFFHLPFILMIAHIVDCRFKALCWSKSPCSFNGYVSQHLPCFMLLCLKALFAYSFWLAYGTMALIVGPLRTWSLLMGIYVWFIASTIDEKDFASAKEAWCPESQSDRARLERADMENLSSATNSDVVS